MYFVIIVSLVVNASAVDCLERQNDLLCMECNVKHLTHSPHVMLD